MYKTLVIIGLSLTLAACQHVASSQKQKLTIYNLQGEAVYDISQDDTLAELQQAFANKTVTTVKIYPVFNHTFNVSLNHKLETWFINAAGYIQPQAGDTTALYRLTLPAEIRDFLRDH